MDAPASETGPQALVGQVLDERYRVLGVLGAGGMGTVLRAEHVSIRRPVAIKLLHGDFAELDKRFEREAFAAAQVDDPHCVTVYDLGRLSDGSLYMAMELVDGRSLAEVIASEGRFAPARALHVTRQILSCLVRAHGKGVVHRDLKPENVLLVDRPGQPDFVKVLDFGIAKLMGDAERRAGGEQLTEAGALFGTPLYMAPEQAFGPAVDHRSDLYSVSAMLFEMLTGRPPFLADEVVAILSMHLTAPVPPLELGTGAAGLEELVRRGLAKEPADRFADAEAYLTAIDALEARRVSSASSPSQPASRPASRPTARFGLIAVAMALTAAVFAVAITVSGDGGQQSSGAMPIPFVTSSSPLASRMLERIDEGDPAAALALAADADDEDAQVRLAGGHALMALGQPDDALASYAAGLSPVPPPGGDARLLRNLGMLLEHRDPDVVSRAMELHGRLAAVDPDARATIVRLASSGPAPAVRRQARALAAELTMEDRIDRLGSFILDLEQGQTCSDRREAVHALRALGDPRAIPSLSEARKRMRRGGILRLQRRNANHCLRADAEDAIRYLEAVRAQ